MQSNEQDEVHDNELARAAAAALERLRPQLGTIAAVVGLAVAGLVGWSLVSSQRDAELAQGWDECIDAVQQRDMARLGDVADRYRGTSAADWSRVLLADAALDEGCALVLTDRAAGLKRLNDAAELYAAVNAGRPRGLVAERAIFGLAKANESLGNLADARRGYETLTSEYPAGPLRGLAESRARDVGGEAAKRWYDWFEKRDATPAQTSEPAAESAAGEPAGAGDAGSAPAAGN